MTPLVNVCGLVVHVAPGAALRLSEALSAMAGVDVHAADGDRLVVTAIDTAEMDALQQMTAINRLPGVVSTSLAYHQTEEAEASCAPGSACCDPTSHPSCACS